MKASPAVLIGGLVVVAAGGFFAGRISSAPQETAKAEVESADRRRGSERVSAAGSESASRQRPGRESSATLLSAEKLARMEMIMRGENPLDRNRALLDLIDKLGPGDFQDVVAQFRALGITESRMGEYSLLLSAWAKMDPLAALEYAKENTQGGFASNTVLATWATNDPDAALRWAEANHEGDGANPYLAGIIRGIAASDPERATSLLSGMPYGEERGRALEGMMQHVLKQGPEAARGWVASLTDERLKNGAIMNMSESMASVDPKGTAEWLLNNPGEASNRRMDDVYETWAQKDLGAAVVSYNTMQGGEQRANALRGVMGTLAGSSPRVALELIDRNPTDVNDGVLRNFAFGAMNQDPEMAVSVVGRITDERERNQTYERTLTNWALKDPVKATSWMNANNTVPERVVQRIQERMQRQP
jgi:hypothetical protein